MHGINSWSRSYDRNLWSIAPHISLSVSQTLFDRMVMNLFVTTDTLPARGQSHLLLQMQELQKAVKRDNRPKLLFSHMPLYGKPSLLYTVLCDTQEREDLHT